MATERSTADILDAALHVREAARSATSVGTGVDTVLAALSEVIEYDHASLARWDPLRRRHTTLAGSYPDDATAYIETHLHHDPVFPVLRSPARGGLWLRDVPGQLLAASPGFQDVLRPLGIEDGVAQCLFAADGRYVGMLNVSTRRPRRAPDPARAVLTLLTEALTAAVDTPAAPPPEEVAAPDPAGNTRRPGGLSPRELQVLAELAAGRTNREIAERLYITPRTVGTHVEHILAKLDAPNRAAAAARAVAWGIEPSAV
ncbi:MULTISPECIES: helix-turn-helix transcriptional regulator [Streptomyces]|uniref:LuxR C-terminal-related transcriptional regulator n=1 Tax=Streptomyces solicathayae TaxID=3081768 RepID=A0ABZ0LMJ6_9ACTN|nr:LuxR C-terminal-related transcriptional regulator [Streptomyces sp. HUAS YS2]WOX20024.1 LuxR C-terminal-related transcriptional regulator [Streptomyces sp. HUAS YS2]